MSRLFPRHLSLRATLMATTGVAFGCVLLVGLIVTGYVVPRAHRLAERGEAAQADFQRRTEIAAQLDSVLTTLERDLEAARRAPLSPRTLDQARTFLEDRLERSVLLEPEGAPFEQPVDVRAALRRADEAGTHLAGAMLGVVAALEIRDLPTAEHLLRHSRQRQAPMATAMSEVTKFALTALTAEEVALSTAARRAQLLVLGWIGLLVAVLPLAWWLFNARLFRPLLVIEDTLGRLEQGDLDATVPVARDDELGRIGAHLNAAALTLREQQRAAEREASFTAREQSEARYREAFEQAEVGLAEIALDGRWVRINRAMCTILRRQPEDIIGRSFRDLTPAADHAADAAAWRQLLDEAVPGVRREKQYIRGDGTLAAVQVTASLLRDDDGRPRHVLSVVRDVTEEQHLAQELAQAKKLDAVGQLAGGVAHDFNNVLMAIIGYADLLEHDDEARPEAIEAARAIRGAATRGADLSRSLLSLARRTPPRRQPFALASVLEETASVIRRTFDRRIAIAFTGDVRATILGDSSLVANALLNLALNARDAMPQGGELRVDAGLTTLAPSFRQLHEMTWAGKYAVITVTDTGSGMAAHVLEHVFEPFFTTKEAGKGTGLGLAMVYSTARNHGGTVTVQSTPGTGTKFQVYLPCEDGGDAPSRGESAPLAAPRDAVVLVVDDEEPVRDVATRMLGRLGYHTEVADDGDAAIRRLDAGGAPIDVMLLDGNMPRLSGVETARYVRARWPALPIIFATGFPSAESDDAMRALGVEHRLAKPYSMEVLSRAVAAVLTGSG